MNRVHDIGVAATIGSYSDAIEVDPGRRWLFLSGTPGMRPDGTLPESFDEQADLAWLNVLSLLAQAEMTVHDLVKVTQYLTDADHIAAHAQIRSRHLGSARPASMLLVVPALVWPGMQIEVEAVAAQAPR